MSRLRILWAVQALETKLALSREYVCTQYCFFSFFRLEVLSWYLFQAKDNVRIQLRQFLPIPDGLLQIFSRWKCAYEELEEKIKPFEVGK